VCSSLWLRQPVHERAALGEAGQSADCCREKSTRHLRPRAPHARRASPRGLTGVKTRIEDEAGGAPRRYSTAALLGCGGGLTAYARAASSGRRRSASPGRSGSVGGG
jgi:hypothetical protein